MADSLNQAAFFAALSVHINAHSDLPELASVSSDRVLHIPGASGIAAAITWAHTLGGEIAVTLGSHSNGETGVNIRGTIAGHDVTVFTVDHGGGLSELLPADVGQPYYERGRSITLTELESHLADATADAPVSKPIPALAPGAEDKSQAEVPPAEDTGEVSDTLEQQFADALGVVFGKDLHAIASSDAYGALKYKVLHRCQRTGETPRQVLDTVSASDRAFVARSDELYAAAFLASRIGDER